MATSLYYTLDMFQYGISDVSMLKKFGKDPTFKHLYLTGKFAIFVVLLKTMDIVTDISTAVDFFFIGEYHWGLFTCLPIVAPFAFRILLAFVAIGKCFKVELNSGIHFINRISANLNANISTCLRVKGLPF